ncbi:MAG: hypothetical protein HY670_11140 [Chloroflexi bacterium]|nr:hypothetical protein [Chloroflexota bacterium]
MQTKTARGTLRVMDGNRAMAEAAKLCRPNVIGAYPITPQSPVVEYLSQFVNEGELNAEYVAVEGEHSAFSVLMGAAMAGGRTFTATSGSGLIFGFEPFCIAPGLRLPIIMGIASREVNGPNILGYSTQDLVVGRDAGWIQLVVENNQEIMDTTIMAYRLAEDPEIMLPVVVDYAGWYLSYASDTLFVPSQEDVDGFLAPVSKPRELRLQPEVPAAFYTSVMNPWRYSEFRYYHCAAMARAKAKFDQIDAEFGEFFGRSYGGQIEEYRTEDAEIVLVAMEITSGTAKVVVDALRDEGLPVGLVKVRMFRPFPRERLQQALRGKKAIGVIDRNVCFGWNSGTLYYETKAALYDSKEFIPIVSFIDGLAGGDVTVDHIRKAINIVHEAAHGKPVPEVTWLAIEDDK